jgi:hypothetical protein
MGYTANETHCLFDSNKSCEIWAFYNQECGKEYVKELECVKIGDSLTPGHKCCNGLVSTGVKTDFDFNGECLQISGAFSICAPCGNSICDSEVENICNCPADCKKTESTCKTKDDCPTLNCIRAPCPSYECINGECKICEKVCDYIGSRSEGWYSSCDRELIEWANCGNESNICEGEDVQDCCNNQSNGLLPACVGSWSIKNNECVFNCDTQEGFMKRLINWFKKLF